MEEIKKKLEEKYKNNIERGLSKEEALSKAIEEERENHDRDSFEKAVVEFLKEHFAESLTEEDPLQAFVDSIYLEYELLLAKVKALFSS
ncbi:MULTISPECIES: hypothetical protein [unclassified Desulfurobacterium]|uniref:hypothetical protein n=1 Tax=unclassified Desulfurobacterium TaxID=2639089 RepID=UPI0003B4458B|nr:MULTISPECIES: hypothetical protein [unclassified Desulfurobacterium]